MRIKRSGDGVAVSHAVVSQKSVNVQRLMESELTCGQILFKLNPQKRRDCTKVLNAKSLLNFGLDVSEERKMIAASKVIVDMHGK